MKKRRYRARRLLTSKLKELDDRFFPGAGLPTAAHQAWGLYAADGSLAAYCVLGIYPNYAFLSRAAVLPEHRGQRLQRRMIKLRERAAKRAGRALVITYTSYDNMRSANNLIACGYRHYLPQREYGTKHALYFERRLE